MWVEGHSVATEQPSLGCGPVYEGSPLLGALAIPLGPCGLLSRCRSRLGCCTVMQRLRQQRWQQHCGQGACCTFKWARCTGNSLMQRIWQLPWQQGPCIMPPCSVAGAGPGWPGEWSPRSHELWETREPHRAHCTEVVRSGRRSARIRSYVDVRRDLLAADLGPICNLGAAPPCDARGDARGRCHLNHRPGPQSRAWRWHWRTLGHCSDTGAPRCLRRGSLGWRRAAGASVRGTPAQSTSRSATASAPPGS